MRRRCITISDSKVKAKYAQKVAKERMRRRMFGIVALIIVIIFLLTLGVAAYSENNGNFTINLNLYDKKYGLCMGETQKALEENPSAKLFAAQLAMADNICGIDLPAEVDSIDGAHNTETSIAYTFYLKNAGQLGLDYSVSLKLIAKAKNVEAALWVRIYEDKLNQNTANNERIRTTYALARLNGEKEQGNFYPQHPCEVVVDESFLSSTVIMSKVRKNFLPTEVHKYTVVLWIEGDDPDCVMEITGGMVRLEMNFTVLGNKTEK